MFPFALFCAALLPAHLGDGGGREPFVSAGALLGGATAVGLVVKDGGDWLRTCEEASGGVTVGAFRTLGGAVLGATVNGLITTDDDGCTWGPADGVLRNLEVSDIAAAHGDPMRVYLTTSRPGAPNALWRSDDGGATFQETALAGIIHPLFDVAPADDGQRVIVTGFDLDEDAPLVRVSDDAGASFAAPSGGALALLGFERVRALAVLERVWFSVLDANGAAALVTTSLALDDLVIEQETASEVLSLVPFGADRFAFARPAVLLRQSQGTGPFLVIEDTAITCLSRADDDSALWGCGAPGSGVQFLRSPDGLIWSAALQDDELDDRVCPPGSPAAVLCTAGVTDAGIPDAGTAAPDDAGTDPADGGPADAGAERGFRQPHADEPRPVSCASGQPASSLWFLLLGALVVRALNRPERANARRHGHPSPSQAPSRPS